MLVFDRRVYDAVVDHAREGTPREVCGVLAGKHGPDRSRATVHRPATNAAATPETRYEIDPVEQRDLMTDIEDGGDEVVGFYHSHPAGPPGPSATDASQAAWDGYSYVIVDLSGAHPFAGSWRWTGDGFEQEPLALA